MSKFNPEYDDNYVEDVIYVGDVHCKENETKTRFRHMTLLTSPEKTYLTKKNKDEVAIPRNFNTANDVVLYESSGGQVKIHCRITEYKGETEVGRFDILHISRRKGKGTYGSQEIALPPDAVYKLKNFLDNLFFEKFENLDKHKIQLEYEHVKASKMLTSDEFKKLVEANIKNIDDLEQIITLKYRQEAIVRFEQIITDATSYKNEVEITKFLSGHQWMFGNEYAYFADNNKIDNKNIVDLAPVNIECFVDIIEVKLPTETLFYYDNGHSNYYPSAELTKAIAQVQNYIFQLEKQSLKPEYQEREKKKIVRPYGIVLIGSKKVLSDGEWQYLRILNSSYHNIRIYTYQQILERAKNLLKTKEDSKEHIGNSDSFLDSDEELPF
ncbi:MAG: DUF4263 domain-containing protein [Firmicutes bacterium]|nr:DUF4263 domain-containing protein [Bacillota bacterium]